jgi:gas vesicle protein
MTSTTSSKIDDAKDHLRDAKNEIKSATQEKTADTLESVGQKVKSGLDHLAEKVSPEDKSKS